jgi:putative peptide zinc metalloprotease protein
LQSRQTSRRLRFDHPEGFALAHFNGHWTVQDVQQQCQQQFGASVDPELVVHLFDKLVQLGVLAPDRGDSPASSAASVPATAMGLKADVQWSLQPDGHWILGDAQGLRHLQVSPADKRIIEQIGTVPVAALAQQPGCSSQQVRQLLTLLAQAQMLEGVEPPAPPQRKFTPLKLLYMKQPLFNPDRWLGRHVGMLGWLWSSIMLMGLSSFLALSGVVALAHQLDLWLWGQSLLAAYGWHLLLPFALLSMAVISLHELAHAFTLKHFGGSVSEMGLLWMCLMPAAYTNSSDSYRLRRQQRCLVIGAGVLCQLIISAIAFWLWFSTSNGSSLHTGAYLLMAAALFTVALNLNPLARFDGYYLISAATGINNLKSRSFGLYAAWLRRQPSPESGRDRWILAAYAPLSFIYLLLVFGRLFLWLGNLLLTHVPYLALVLLGLWLIYYFYPSSQS